MKKEILDKRERLIEEVLRSVDESISRESTANTIRKIVDEVWSRVVHEKELKRNPLIEDKNGNEVYKCGNISYPDNIGEGACLELIKKVGS